MRGGTSACTVGAGLDVLEKIFRELQLYGAVFAEGGRCAVGQHADQGASRCYGGAEGTWSAGDREVARQQGESSSQDGGRCTGGSQTVVKDPPPLSDQYLVVDRAYEDGQTRKLVKAMGIPPVVPPKRNRKKP